MMLLFDNGIFLDCVKSILCCSMASKDVEAPPASSSTSSTTTITPTTATTPTALSTAPSIPASTASITNEPSSTTAATTTPPGTNSSEGGTTTYTSRSTLFSSPINYSLKEGEFLHDSREGDKTLMQYVNHVGAMNVFDIFFDYNRVLTQNAEQSASAFYREENSLLNRYNDIRCIDATRVFVPTSDGKDYLHANYVDGYREEKRYILTQAPLEATFERFWEMVWKENSTMIIALTPLDGEKCPIYLPIGSGQSKEYGKIKVVNMGTRHIRDTYDATLLMITKDGAPIRTILHLIFFSWPDKETPIRPTEIIHFIDDINFNRNILMKTAQNKGWLTNASTSKSPIIIHCKAGVGRSGTLAAIDICSRKLDDTFKRGNPAVDVRDTVLRLRTQREMAVQKPEQYLFIHLSVFEYAVRKRYFENIEDVNLDLFLNRKPKK